MNTATNIAKPYIQAVLRLSGSAVPTYTPIVIRDATIKILSVKSYKA